MTWEPDRRSAAQEPGAAPFFPAVEPASPAYPVVDRLREAVTEAGLLDGSGLVQAELRLRTGPGHEPMLRRFYWSRQQRRDGAFAARTLHREADPARVYDFPTDPVLRWLDRDDGPLQGHGPGAQVDVLRYVPLRRVTLRLVAAAGLPEVVVAKAKRRRGLDRAATALRAVDEAVGRTPRLSARLPRPLGSEPTRHLLYLEHLPGVPLDEAMPGLDVREAMQQLGTVHRELHGLDVRGLRTGRRVADWLADVHQAVGLLSLLAPSTAGVGQRVREQLARTAPADAQPVYCQGDLTPAQVLVAPDGWSVVDLDDSHLGDPLAEVGALWVALPHDLGLAPADGEAARAAYVEAYARRSGPAVDQARLRWFAATQELLGLAHRAEKGRAGAEAVPEVLERLAGPLRTLG